MSAFPLPRGRARLGALLATVAASTVAAGCMDDIFGASKDEQCKAEAKDDDPVLTIPSQIALALAASDYQTYVTGNTRTFEWWAWRENVCSAKHIKAVFRFMTNQAAPMPEGFTVMGRYEYGNFGGTAAMPRDPSFPGSNFYLGQKDFGIAQVYPDEPGVFTLYVSVSFRTTGNAQRDREILQQLWHADAGGAEATWYEHNPDWSPSE